MLSRAFGVLVLAAGLVSARLQKFDFTITKGNVSPDGFTRQAFLINGITPGPDITVDHGDDVQVNVKNNSPDEITIHFHGIKQKGTIFSDGVPGVTQELIQPGGTFHYKWKATDAGAYWYHAHSRSLYSDGLRGTIYVRSLILDPRFYKTISSNILDMAALEVAHRSPNWIKINEWQHFDSETELNLLNTTNIEPICASSMLVNGVGQQLCLPPSAYEPYIIPGLLPTYTNKGCAPPDNPVTQFPGSRPDLVTDRSIFFDCTPHETSLPIIKVDPFFRYAAISIVNMGGMWDAKVSIDNHKMWIYAADGQLVVPQQVDAVNVPLGDRFQAFVKLDQTPGDYIIRISANVIPQKISGYAVLSYKRRRGPRGLIRRLLDLVPRQVNAQEDVSPASVQSNGVPPSTSGTKMGYGSEMINGGIELNAASLVPYPASIRPPAAADKLIVMELGRPSAAVNVLNKDPFSPFLELQEPLLFNPSRAANLSPNLVPSYPVGTVVDLVFVVNPLSPPHSIHKHGNKAFVIGQGDGPWVWNSVAEAQAANPASFNLNNPPLRDGFLTAPALGGPTWLVVRFKSEEPAPITLHCHIQMHSSTGMVAVLMEGAQNFPPVPAGLTG